MAASPRYTIAIETTAPIGSVALAADGQLLGSVTVDRASQSQDTLIPCIQALCDRFALTIDEHTRIAVSLGPGGFTGLRIAVTACKMFALAVHTPIIPIPTASILAHKAHPEPPTTPDSDLIVCLGLKKTQAWVQRFRPAADHWQPDLQPNLLTPDRIIDPSFATNLAFALTDRIDPDWSTALKSIGVELRQTQPDAATMIHLLAKQPDNFQPVDPAQLSPIYAREPEAVRLWRQRNASP